MAAQIDENIQYTDPSTGELLNNGYIYIGADGLDAKLNAQTIYADRELTIPLVNPQRIGSDGRALNKIWVSGKYSMKVENYENVQKLNDLSLGEIARVGNTVLSNVAGADAITADASPTITALTDKEIYIFTAASTNTGAMTLTIDLTSTYPIKKYHDGVMQAGDIEANQVVSVAWNATDSVFELVSASSRSALYPTTKAEAAGLTYTAADAGRVIHITSDDGGKFVVKYNATLGTYNDNGGSYCGTEFRPTGGDGTIGLVRDYSGAVNVKWFGAVGDGVTDDTTAIKAHVTYLNTVGGIGYYPEGVYLYSSTTFTSPHNNVTIQGSGRYASVIKATVDNAQIFYLWGNGSSVRDISFESSVTQTGGTYIQAAGVWNIIENIRLDGDHTGILVTGVGTNINHVVLNNGASGGVRITFDCGDTSPSMSNVLAAAQSAPYPTAGIRLKNVTALKVSDCDMINQGTALLINPGNGESVSDAKISQSFFDSSTTGISINPTGTGTVGRVRLISCWSGTSSGNGVSIQNSGTGEVKGIEFIGHESGACANYGIYSIGTGIQDVSIIGGVFGGNGGDGIRLEHTGSAKVIGVDSGNYQYLGVNGGYGAYLGAALTGLVFKNNRLLNNTSGSLSDNTGTIVKFISDNDITGYAKSGTIAVGASPFIYTPLFNQVVYINGGTITGIVVDGITLFASTDNTISLRKGQSVQVTYSGGVFMNYTA